MFTDSFKSVEDGRKYLTNLECL